MSTGTAQQIYNQRTAPTYGIGGASAGGGGAAGLSGTAEFFVTESIGVIGAAGNASSSARATQGLVRYRGYAFADQTIVVRVQVSLDGVTFRTPDTTAAAFIVTAAAANAYVFWDVPAVAPFMRVNITNSGAGATTITEVVSDLIAGG